MFKAAVGIIAVLIISACGNYSNTNSPLPNEGNQKGKGTTDVSFAQIRNEILEPHCISCHKGRHDVYENYQIVKASAFQMLQRMESDDPSRRMPEDNPALPEATIALFRTWVNAGAPEFGNAKSETPDNKEDNTGSENRTISFSQIKDRVLDSYNCTTCHAQYNNYARVKGALGSISQLIMDNKMPFPQKKGEEVIPVRAEDKEYLLTWINQGAPEFEDGSSQTTLDTELKPTYLSIRNNILGPRCTMCHNSFGGRGPKNFDSLLEIKKSDENPKSPLFDFDDPFNSRFIGAIIARPGQLFFDPMPYVSEFDDVETEFPPVTDEELKVIEEWIKLKLPYDESEL